MNEEKSKMFIMALEGIFIFGLTVIVSTIIFGLIKDVSNRELIYNPSMPILSRIIVCDDGVNIREIIIFLCIEMLVFYLPKIGFLITNDSKGSVGLCIMPAVLWGIMAVFSYHIAMPNTEIPLFFVAAAVQTIVSMILYLRYVGRFFDI